MSILINRKATILNHYSVGSKNQNIIINKNTGLKVLLSRNAKIIIPKLHRDREHIKAVKLERLVKQSYDVQGFQPFVREVVGSCDYFSDQIVHRLFNGPLVRASLLTLDRNCNELGLVINEKPLLENDCSKNDPSLDPTSCIPKTVDTIDPNYNWVCAALSTILMGNPNQGGKIDEVICSLPKRPGPPLIKTEGRCPSY